MSTTMEDVARYAAVSTATVSRVLNTPEKVNEETRQRVLDAIEALNYRMNAIARSFRTQHTHQIAVLMGTLHDPLAAAILEAFESAAAQQGYSILLGLTRHDYVHRLIDKGGAEGVLCLGSDNASLDQRDLPLVRLGDLDYFGAAYQATKTLLELGHHQIALLAHGELAQQREGYLHALKKSGITPHQMGGITAKRENDAPTIIENLLAERPSAVFAGGDQWAVQVMCACFKRGWRVPEDVSIVGCGDSPLARQMGLASLRFPTADIGRAAFFTLLSRIQGKTEPPKRLPAPQFVMRDSVARR